MWNQSLDASFSDNRTVVPTAPDQTSLEGFSNSSGTVVSATPLCYHCGGNENFTRHTTNLLQNMFPTSHSLKIIVQVSQSLKIRLTPELVGFKKKLFKNHVFLLTADIDVDCLLPYTEGREPLKLSFRQLFSPVVFSFTEWIKQNFDWWLSVVSRSSTSTTTPLPRSSTPTTRLEQENASSSGNSLCNSGTLVLQATYNSYRYRSALFIKTNGVSKDFTIYV